MNSGKLEITTPTDREMVMTRVFNAPSTLVFECYTKPELLKRWMTGPDGWTFAICEVDLKVDGKFRFVWRNVRGNDMGMGGVYKEIVAPERLVHTELFDEDWTGGETLTTLILTDQSGKTFMKSTTIYSSKEARDGALGTNMEQGMNASFDRLENLLASLGKD
ncbi:ATPase [Leptospira ilyithenensis]|uniref:ATPase n=2 Tax=Leptospira ilyithenensis TaxID=2484901 RepID=A0A4R9LTZ7_9LEPT|nr:ATPase [Leptospira ilyithenensis]